MIRGCQPIYAVAAWRRRGRGAAAARARGARGGGAAGGARACLWA
jgi:hypothetical protein